MPIISTYYISLTLTQVFRIGAIQAYEETQVFFILKKLLIQQYMNPKYSETLISHKNAGKTQIPEHPNQIIEKAYQEIADCQNELKNLKKLLEERAELPQDDKVFIRGKMVIKVDTIYRLKRFLLILNENRLGKIQKQLRQFGGEIQKNQLNKLSEKQKNFLLQYKKLSNQYMDNVQLQLNMDLNPPIDSLVEIRVVNDCGEIMELADQGIKLQKNSVHLIKRRLVQKLIQRGDVLVIG